MVVTSAWSRRRGAVLCFQATTSRPDEEATRREGSLGQGASSMASAQQLRRLQRVEVDGLFGLYDHRIDLELNDRVTFLHGPNGVGKTTVLRMIDAVLTDRFDYFSSIPFKRFLLRFDDKAELELDPQEWKTAGGRIRLIARGYHESVAVESALSDAAVIAAEVGHLVRERDIWVDIRDGEPMTDSEVVRKFAGLRLSGGLAMRHRIAGEDVQKFREFLDGTNSYLIEAQRLVRPRRPGQVPSRVVDCSTDLKRRIDDTMAEYGRQAQVLDQTFPQRLLQRNDANDNLSIEELRERMSELDSKTKALKDIGILDETRTPRFQLSGDMEKSQAGVMTLYVDDTAKKLRVLEDLARRARLLLESLNGKFQHKQMRVDRDKGLVVVGDYGDSLPPDSLSSGEQHELILHYDLLFRVAPNTVVLLDEPELSLHLEWQSRFLSDLMAIVQLSSFDALVATHSPSIVGERDDLMVELAG